VTDILFSDIEKHFAGRRILRGVNLRVSSGECQLLCGENGAGKSTLLRILAGMEAPNAGLVTDDHGQLRWRRARRQLLRDVIYLHQHPYLFEGTVEYNLRYPVRGSRIQRSQLVRKGLEWSGLTDLADQPVHNLSGGERQRVALARAWLRHPRVMLLDEPTTNMDSACRRRTVDLLQTLRDSGVALIIATHDPMHFATLADRVWHLADGRLDEEPAAPSDFPDKVTPIKTRIRVTA